VGWKAASALLVSDDPSALLVSDDPSALLVSDDPSAPITVVWTIENEYVEAQSADGNSGTRTASTIV
jgi:hypothetical protein